MPARKALPVQLSSEHERELNELVRAHSTPQRLAERARIILLAATGLGIDETAQRLGIWRKMASRGRRRVAGWGTLRWRGSAPERRASPRCTSDVHTGSDRPDHGPGL